MSNLHHYLFNKAAWKRLRKNKGAVFGFIVITLAVLVAVFAYFIAPDPSPYANRIILEIGGSKPGYTQSFIKSKKRKDGCSGWISSATNLWQRRCYYYVPIVSYERTGDSIIVQKYIDEG